MEERIVSERLFGLPIFMLFYIKPVPTGSKYKKVPKNWKLYHFSLVMKTVRMREDLIIYNSYISGCITLPEEDKYIILEELKKIAAEKNRKYDIDQNNFIIYYEQDTSYSRYTY